MAGLIARIGGAWLVAAVVAAPAHAALPICTASISACCQITKPGTYDFAGTVTASAGGDCIKVTVPGVILNLDNNFLEGSNKATPVGIGIHVLATAPRTIVNGGVDFSAGTPVNIAYFATGIRNDAARASFLDFFVLFSGGNGVVNNGANANFVDFNSSSNGGNGIIDNADGALIIFFTVDDNTANGVALRSPPAPAPLVTNVSIRDFEANGNSAFGVKLKDAVANDVEAFDAFGNGADGVQVKHGSGNKLSDFNAGLHSQTRSGNTGYGLSLIDSSIGNFIDNFETSLNGQGGVRVGSNGNHIDYFSSFSNTGAGVWLDGASHNMVSDAYICGNTTSGVYLGCSAGTLPSNTSCGTAPHSNGNLVANTVPRSNVVGIGIDKGNHNNRVVANDALYTSAPNPPCSAVNTTDLEDDNTNCDSNFWIFNGFTSALPPACIH